MTFNQYKKECRKIDNHNQKIKTKFQKAAKKTDTTRGDLDRIAANKKEYPAYCDLPKKTRAKVSIQRALENSSVDGAFERLDKEISLLDSMPSDKDLEDFVLLRIALSGASFGFISKEEKIFWREAAGNWAVFARKAKRIA